MLADCLVLLCQEGADPDLFPGYLDCLFPISDALHRRNIILAVQSTKHFIWSFDRDRARLLGFLAALPPAERHEFAQQAQDLVHSLKRPEYFWLYLPYLTGCARDQRREFGAHLKQIDRHLFTGWMGIGADHMLRDVIQAVAATPPKEREELIRLALSFLERIGCPNSLGAYEATAQIFHTLRTLPQEARASFAEDIASFVCQFECRMDCVDALKGLGTASRSERSDLLARVRPLVHGDNIASCGKIVRALAAVSLGERKELADWSQKLAQRLRARDAPRHAGAIAEVLAKVASTERKDVCDCIFPLVGSALTNLYDLECGFAILSAIPQGKRERALGCVRRERWGRWKTVQALGRLEEEEWPRFFDEMHTIFGNKELHPDFIAETLSTASPETRQLLIAQGTPLFHKILSQQGPRKEQEIACTLPILGQLSAEDSSQLVAQTLRLTEKCKNGAGWIFKVLSQVRKEARETLVELLLSLLSEKEGAEEAIHLIALLRKVPEEEQKLLAQHALSLGEAENKLALLRALKPCPEPERMEICCLAREAAERYGLLNNHSLARFIRHLRQLPKERRSVDVQNAHQFLRGVMKGGEAGTERLAATLAADMLGCPIPELIWLHLPLIAPACRALYCKAILLTANRRGFQDTHLGKEQPFRRLLNYAFSNPDLRRSSHDHLLRLLDSEELLPNERQSLCLMVHPLIKELRLQEHEPLLIAFANQMWSCDPQSMEAINNPYRLYRVLGEQLAQEKDCIIEAAVVDESIGGRRGRWARLKPAHRLPISYTSADLPAGVAEGTARELFDRLIRRLRALPKEERELILHEIKEGHLLDLARLQKTLLDNLSPLLELPSNPESPILPVQVYLFRSLKAIQEAFDRFEPDSRLSSGEEMLLKLSTSLHTCRGGRHEGVVKYYHLLPPSYQSPSDRPVVSERGPARRQAERLVKECVQKVLLQGIMDEALLQEVTGRSVIQTPHVTLYLANRIGQQIGLAHSLQFDAHTELLNESLLNKSAGELLTSFFCHCSLQRAVEQLIDASAPLLDGKAYLGTVELLEETPTGSRLDECFECNEEEIPQRLTPIGALRLLASLSYAELLG